MGILFAHRAKKPRPHAKAKDKTSIKQWESSPDIKLNLKKMCKKIEQNRLLQDSNYSRFNVYIPNEQFAWS